jgi:hypothetical protein
MIECLPSTNQMEYSTRQGKKEKKVKKVKLEITTNNQVNKVQQQNQQELFDLETKRKIKDSALDPTIIIFLIFTS